jgi:hypothetical protein
LLRHQECCSHGTRPAGSGCSASPIPAQIDSRPNRVRIVRVSRGYSNFPSISWMSRSCHAHYIVNPRITEIFRVLKALMVPHNNTFGHIHFGSLLERFGVPMPKLFHECRPDTSPQHTRWRRASPSATWVGNSPSVKAPCGKRQWAPDTFATGPTLTGG